MIKRLAIAVLLGAIAMQIATYDGTTVEKSGAEQIQGLYEEGDSNIMLLPVTEDVLEYQESLQEKKAERKPETLSEKEQEEEFQKQIERLETKNSTLTWPEGVEAECWLKTETVADTKVYSLKMDGGYDRIVIYLHGGAYIYNLSEHHIRFGEELAATTNAKVIIPMYRLAPQSSYKEAYELLTEVYQESLKEGKEITIMGDSAGGGLSLGFAEYLNQKKITIPDKLVLISPWTDITLTNPMIKDYEPCDLKLNAEKAARCGELWADGLDPKDYRVSPLYGDLTNLPKVLMTLGTEEILVPDDMLLYDKIKEGGNYIRLVLGEGMYHNYPLLNLDNSITTRLIIESFIRM